MGHIPGTAFWNIYRDLKDSRYRLVDASALENILSTSGIAPGTKVVFYGYGPVLGYWLLNVYRHPDVSVLNLSKRGRSTVDDRSPRAAADALQAA